LTAPRVEWHDARVAGYSGTPLAKKLGIKPGHRVLTQWAPAEYGDWIAPLPSDVTVSARLRPPLDIIHAFVTKEADLVRLLGARRSGFAEDGALWISWPKKSSGMATEVTEDVIRRHALPLGLVDVKVCAVSDVWSGLKLVVRKELRKR
jgi:hypothetical protein